MVWKWGVGRRRRGRRIDDEVQERGDDGTFLAGCRADRIGSAAVAGRRGAVSGCVMVLDRPMMDVGCGRRPAGDGGVCVVRAGN